MSTIRELRQKRAAIVEKARHLVDICDQEERRMNEEEVRDYEGFMGEIDSLGTDIERREKLQDLSAEMGNPDNHGDVLDPHIGMSPSELKRYSLVRAIRAAAQRDWRGAELEKEASEAFAKRIGLDPQGFWIPPDWMERRDLVVGTPTAGGHLVATDLLSQSFIEMLRNRMILRQAGAQFLGGLVGDIAIPKQTGGGTAYWVTESGSPTEGQQTVGQVTMTPHTLGAFTDISRKLLKQSSIDVEMFVRKDLSSTLGIEIDRVGLHGSGSSNQPTGVAATTGIGSVAGGANGAAPDWDDIVDLETEVAVDNADIGSLAYITNPKVRGKLKKTVIGTDQRMVWEKNPDPLNGYPAHVSSQVASNLVKGTSGAVCSAIFYGNWADLIIGMWGGLDVLVDPYTGGTSGTVRVVTLQDVDVAVRHAESFAAMLDALTV
jgi:HK97 family phage major capsid protein